MIDPADPKPLHLAFAVMFSVVKAKKFLVKADSL